MSLNSTAGVVVMVVVLPSGALLGGVLTPLSFGVEVSSSEPTFTTPFVCAAVFVALDGLFFCFVFLGCGAAGVGASLLLLSSFASAVVVAPVCFGIVSSTKLVARTGGASVMMGVGCESLMATVGGVSLGALLPLSIGVGLSDPKMTCTSASGMVVVVVCLDVVFFVRFVFLGCGVPSLDSVVVVFFVLVFLALVGFVSLAADVFFFAARVFCLEGDGDGASSGFDEESLSDDVDSGGGCSLFRKDRC
jgi:hypothetical protein